MVHHYLRFNSPQDLKNLVIELVNKYGGGGRDFLGEPALVTGFSEKTRDRVVVGHYVHGDHERTRPLGFPLEVRACGDNVYEFTFADEPSYPTGRSIQDFAKVHHARVV